MNDIIPASIIALWFSGHIVNFFNKWNDCFIKSILSLIISLSEDVLCFKCNKRINEIRLSNDEDISSFELVDIGEDIFLFSKELLSIISDVILNFLFLLIDVKSMISDTFSSKLFLNSSSLNDLFNNFRCSS